jgi:hypothetical protein
MGQVRAYGTSITNGVPIIAIVADEDNPTDHTAVGGPDAAHQVETRWERYLGRGMEPTLDTLGTTMSGSHVGVSAWEPVEGSQEEAAAATEEVLRAGQPLPGAFVVPAKA